MTTEGLSKIQHVDPRGAIGEPGDDMAVARRMPIAALVAVLAERGEPGDVTAEELTAVLRLDREATAGPWEARLDDVGATWTVAKVGFGRIGVAAGVERNDAALIVAARTFFPRLAREVVILRALAPHKLPCGHELADIVYGRPDLNGLPAIAQCGQCLADRQAAKAALPRTPERVLRAMLRAYEAAALEAFADFYRVYDGGDLEREAARVRSNRLDAEVVALRSACAWTISRHALDIGLRRLLSDYEARLAGTRPLDAPPMETP